MKSIILNLVLLFLSTFCFAQNRVFQEVTVVGNRVNIRTEPNLSCKVVYQKDWGATFQGARYNDEWIELIDNDGKICYGYHKYIKFVEPEITQQTLSSNTLSSSKNLTTTSINNSDLVIQESEPHIIYQSEVYTLDKKPTNLPQPTAGSTTSSIKPSTNVTSSISTSRPVEKVVVNKPIIKTEKPIHKAEKIIQSTPVTMPSVTESVAKTESNVKVIETKPITEAKKEIKKVEKVVVAKPKPKPIAEVKKEVKKTETVVKTKPVVTKPVAEAKKEIKKVEKVVVAKPKPKPVAEVKKEVKKVKTHTKAQTVATKPVSQEEKDMLVDEKMIAAAMDENPEVLEVIILLEQLEAYVELKNMQDARKIALDLINNHVDESLESNDETCILVGEEAYNNYISILPDNGTRIPELRRLLNDVYDPLVTNLIRLDLIDNWIQKEEYQYALDIMDNTMVHNSESLTFPKHCENDPNLKASPQIELKNKYFLVYHMMDDKKKKEILSNLKKLTKAKNPVTQNIAKDVYKKISGDFWEKN